MDSNGFFVDVKQGHIAKVFRCNDESIYEAVVIL